MLTLNGKPKYTGIETFARKGSAAILAGIVTRINSLCDTNLPLPPETGQDSLFAAGKVGNDQLPLRTCARGSNQIPLGFKLNKNSAFDLVFLSRPVSNSIASGEFI